jgi:hypothetical protein
MLVDARYCYLFAREGELWVLEEEWTGRFNTTRDAYRAIDCRDRCAHIGPLSLYEDDVDEDDPDYNPWTDGPVAEELAWYAIARGWPYLYEKLVKKRTPATQGESAACARCPHRSRRDQGTASAAVRADGLRGHPQDGDAPRHPGPLHGPS